jgi:hypothetical protein
MQSNWGRAVVCVLTVPTALALLTGCSVIPGSTGSITVSGTAGPAGVTSKPSAAGPSDAGSPGNDSPGNGSAPAGSSGAKKGCAPGGAAIPSGAATGLTQDLDGDGLKDTLWLADKGSSRILGVETASGGRFSRTFSSASPVRANAVAGRLGDGSAIILLDFNREAKLYAVTGCKIVPTLNTQGRQYTFDEGYTGYGSGAGCPVVGASGRRLVGYLAKPGGHGDGYIVKRTLINLSKNGTRATNGPVEVLGEGLPGSDKAVTTAQEIICADGDRVLEPVN